MKNIPLLKNKITKISDKTIESLTIEMKWEGSGSELDPIVIDQVESFPVIVKIYRNPFLLLFTGVY